MKREETMASFGGWVLVMAIAFLGGFVPLWAGLSGRLALLIMIIAVVVPAAIYYYFMIDSLEMSARGMWPLALALQYIQSVFAAGLGFVVVQLLKKLLK